MFGTDGRRRKEEIDCDDGQRAGQEQEQQEEGERGKLREGDARPPAMDGTDEMSEEGRK